MACDRIEGRHQLILSYLSCIDCYEMGTSGFTGIGSLFVQVINNSGEKPTLMQNGTQHDGI